MAVFIVLLRAIGPLTHKIMSMTQWRDGVAQAGFGRLETYVATGNMIVESSGDLASVTQGMNEIAAALGLAPSNRAIVRTPEQLQMIYDADPLPEASATRPSQMGVYFFAAEQPDLQWTKTCDGPENLRVVQQHLIVDYNGRVSDSKPLGSVEKKSGLGTARNWNTLRTLVERSTARLQQGH